MRTCSFQFEHEHKKLGVTCGWRRTRIYHIIPWLWVSKQNSNETANNTHNNSCGPHQQDEIKTRAYLSTCGIHIYPSTVSFSSLTYWTITHIFFLIYLSLTLSHVPLLSVSFLFHPLHTILWRTVQFSRVKIATTYDSSVICSIIINPQSCPPNIRCPFRSDLRVLCG